MKNISQVIKTLFLLLSLISLSIAEVHPGLKSAIDSGDIKTAETLVKKIGVKDIYCPANLAFENAMKLYGDSFSESPRKMWEICDSVFIENAKDKVCKTSVPLCKQLLHRTSIYSWEPRLKEILESKLNSLKEKKIVKKDELKKISKQECFNQIENAKQVFSVFLAKVHEDNCNPKDDFSTISCTLFYLPMKDSLEKLVKQEEKQCKKNPRKKVTKEVEELQEVNSFMYEAEVYGLVIMAKIRYLFNNDSNFSEELKIYKQLKNNNVKSSQTIKDMLNDFVMRPKNEKHAAYTAACIVDPEIQYYRRPGDDFKCQEEIENMFGSMNFHLSSDKKNLMKEIISIYAKSGKIPDYLLSHSCRLYPDIENDILKMSEIKMIDCGLLKQYTDENVNCVNKDSIYIWKSPLGTDYICDGRRWRAPRSDEEQYNSACSRINLGDVKDSMFCWVNGWIKNYGYSLLKDERDGHIYRTVKIGTQQWMAENLGYEQEGFKYRYEAFYNWSMIEKTMLKENNPYEQTICPSGWHLPDSTEWELLFTTVGGKQTAGNKLKSTSKYWVNSISKNGEDLYGFNVLPYRLYNDNFRNGNEDIDGAFFLSYRKTKTGNTAFSKLLYDPRIVWFGPSDKVGFEDFSYVDDYKNKIYYTIRCVKD